MADSRTGPVDRREPPQPASGQH